MIPLRPLRAPRETDFSHHERLISRKARRVRKEDVIFRIPFVLASFIETRPVSSLYPIRAKRSSWSSLRLGGFAGTYIFTNSTLSFSQSSKEHAKKNVCRFSVHLAYSEMLRANRQPFLMFVSSKTRIKLT